MLTGEFFLTGLKQAIAFCVLALLAAACSSPDEEPYSSMSAQQIYQIAEAELRDSEVEKAAEIFEEVERLYPYSEWARRGTIMAAFAYGQAEDFERSRSAAQRFLASYPGDTNAAYAQYLVAMSYYEQLDARGRDQQNTRRAIEEMNTLIEEYGNSDYAKSAMLKFDLAVNHLASKEMEIGRYYLKRKNYTAAIRRFQYVVDVFGTTAQAPEALHRLVEAYLSLGLYQEAREAAAVLGFNYQNSEWYSDTYRLFVSRGLEAPGEEESENLISQFYRRTIKGEWL